MNLLLMILDLNRTNLQQFIWSLLKHLRICVAIGIIILTYKH